MIFVIQVIATVSSVFSARANMCVIATLIADIPMRIVRGAFSRRKWGRFSQLG